MKILLPLLSLLLLATGFSQTHQNIESKVSRASIFRDRALVTRTAEQNLAQGNFTLVFSNLTTDLQDASVQMSAAGPGEIKIVEVKVERRFTSEIQNKKMKTLQKQLYKLEQKRQQILDNVAVLESKKAFIESLKAESAALANTTMLTDKSPISKWTEILNFVELNLSLIYKEFRQESINKDGLEQQITAIQNTMNITRRFDSRDYKEIIVKVQISHNGKYILEPSYIVQQAGWYPTYDARMFTDSKSMQLSYFGMIHQSTGEDWEDVNLTLSTANPISSGNLPNLQRWFVDMKPIPGPRKAGRPNTQSSLDYEKNHGLPAGMGAITGYIADNETGEPLPGVNITIEGKGFTSTTDANGRYLISNVPMGKYLLKANMIGYQGLRKSLTVAHKYTTKLDMNLIVQQFQGEEVVITAPRPKVMRDQTNSVSIVTTNTMNSSARSNYTQVETKELSTIFEIPMPYSIPSDNSQHKVTIAIESLPIEMSYASIPEESPAVFLTGKIINTKDYPFLAGDINLFVDNDFVNKIGLETMVASDTVHLALGADDRIQAQKILLNKFTESKGLLKGNKKITYEYEIQITNHHNTEKIISISDHIPISMNKNIKIELFEPAVEKLKAENRLEWKLQLKAGENKILALKYAVEFPANKNVYGLK
jgi:hypothetical protein